MPPLRTVGCIGLLLLGTTVLTAEPLSKSRRIDFFRDTASRELQGAAVRSDGRLLTGPRVSSLDVDLGGDLLWSLAADGQQLLLGTGPDGKVLRIDPKSSGRLTAEVALDLPESHVFAVVRLANGDLLVGTSPQGTLVLARGGQVIARVALPVDSVFDFAVLPPEAGQSPQVLVATGNPGRIYQVDLIRLAQAGDSMEKSTTDTGLADKGITLWGSVRDDNLRRLQQLPDGRVIAGSAPKGNVYEFPARGGAPIVLEENRHAEVTDLLPWPGGFYAAVTFTTEPGDARLKRAKDSPPGAKGKEDAPETDTAILVLSDPTAALRFHGRSQLVWFPDGGFPEVVVARNNTAFYRLQRHDDLILITGGEEGELLGYDPASRRSLTFPGAISAQLNAIVPAADTPGAYHALGNNPAGLVLVDFNGRSAPRIETKPIDLGSPASIGALRFVRPLAFPADRLTVELRASFSSDELEGWSAWQRAIYAEGGWQAPDLRGRYVQLRLGLPPAAFELSSAEIFYLPRNRRPQLMDFRVLSPNFALIPAAAPSEAPGISTLSQMLQPGGQTGPKAPTNFLASQVVPQTGTQVVFWTMSDPDGDNVVNTFSLRHAGDEQWTDLAVDISEPYVQFEISHLPEGLYHTRLVATETAPRPPAERLGTTFETDDFLVDRTPPAILSAEVGPRDHQLLLTVRIRDALSLLAGVEVNLNNGFKTSVEQPADGILDSREEMFAVEVPLAKVSGSTSVEVIAYDNLGNSSARRLALPAY